MNLIKLTNEHNETITLNPVSIETISSFSIKYEGGNSKLQLSSGRFLYVLESPAQITEMLLDTKN